MPALNSGHTIGHIAAPDLIRRCYRELPVEMVRYFNVFVPAAFVFMRRGLTTGDIQLFHQLTCKPSPESDAPAADHRGDTSRASRATTGIPDFTDETPFDGPLSVRIPAIFTNVTITASVNTEQPAQWRYRVVRPQTVDYRELFRESDIKSAVVDSTCQRNTLFNYLFRCFELQCLSRPGV
ncbi:Mobile element protein (plasmid) [Klebsiella sp. PL-2018]|nr:Mobile element protein [Klebsiella sp. PL-2018]